MQGSGLQPIRRVVTIEASDGVAAITDDTTLATGRIVAPDVWATHVWATAAAPAAYASGDDGAGLLKGTPPPPGGTRIGVLELGPGAAAGPLHRTDTVDYAVCVIGEIDLVTPDTRATLRPGDIVVQCGATHTWENRGANSARLVFVMIDAAPKRAGSLGSEARV